MIKRLLPEIVFVIGAASALIAMWDMMGSTYAVFFGGAILILVSAYLHTVMSVEIKEEN